MAKKKKVERKRYTARSARSSKRNPTMIRRVIVTLVIIVIVVITLASFVFRDSAQTIFAETAIGSLISTIQAPLSSAAQNVKEFFIDWRSYDKLEDEFEALSKENRQLSLELSNAAEAIQENDRLKTLLNAKSDYESLDPIYARVIGRDAGQWFSTFSINRGTMHGLSVGMAVVNSDGLIGRIYKVGLNYANVISIIDPRSGLACLVQRTRDNGIMRGGISTTADHAECYVYYLPNINNIIPGDVVITSGTDSIYPKGLTIGTVTEVSLDASADGSYAVITPAVDFLRIEEVLVLRNVVEKASDDKGSMLPAIQTPSPAPTATPSPTPDVDDESLINPNVTEGNWEWPTAGADDVPQTPAPHLEKLPEDNWIDED